MLVVVDTVGLGVVLLDEDGVAPCRRRLLVFCGEHIVDELWTLRTGGSSPHILEQLQSLPVHMDEVLEVLQYPGIAGSACSQCCKPPQHPPQTFFLVVRGEVRIVSQSKRLDFVEQHLLGIPSAAVKRRYVVRSFSGISRRRARPGFQYHGRLFFRCYPYGRTQCTHWGLHLPPPLVFHLESLYRPPVAPELHRGLLERAMVANPVLVAGENVASHVFCLSGTLRCLRFLPLPASNMSHQRTHGKALDQVSKVGVVKSGAVCRGGTHVSDGFEQNQNRLGTEFYMLKIGHFLSKPCLYFRSEGALFSYQVNYAQLQLYSTDYCVCLTESLERKPSNVRRETRLGTTRRVPVCFTSLTENIRRTQPRKLCHET